MNKPAIRTLTRTALRGNFTKTSPPSYFSNGNGRHVPLHYRPANPMKNEGLKRPMREVAMIISIATLCFFALDNYRIRNDLQHRVEADQIQQREKQEFMTKQMNASRRKRELQILNERKFTKMREMKMALHIAMLRKQLKDNGIDPWSIEDCLNEYAKTVKMENSISNVSGTALWIMDDSTLKAYVPNVREYEIKPTNEEHSP